MANDMPVFTTDLGKKRWLGRKVDGIDVFLYGFWDDGRFFKSSAIRRRSDLGLEGAFEQLDGSFKGYPSRSDLYNRETQFT